MAERYSGTHTDRQLTLVTITTVVLRTRYYGNYCSPN